MLCYQKRMHEGEVLDMSQNYNGTIRACFIGYIVQAIVVNFVPLLFLTFHSSYGIPLSQITLLVTINFGLQLTVDAVSAGFIDKIGYRAAAVLAHVLSALGLAALAVLPNLMGNAFAGLLISVMIYACGGGLLEVLVSPIVESCPSEHKEKTMSLLHSFYSWGQVGVVLLSTLFFWVFGIKNWPILAALWAIVPVYNAFQFLKVPIAQLDVGEDGGLRFRALISKRTFWVLLLLMLCAGACEQAVSQWASAFAEQGLGVSKTVGDLAGPMMFAVMMGLTRVFYGKYGDRLNLSNFMLISGLLCAGSYLVISLSPWPVLGLIGCGLCGLSVGIMWPGTLSTAAQTIRGGGTAMFAFLALAGDLGCSGGPTLVGFVSGLAGDNLKVGILSAIVFPIVLIAGVVINRRMAAKE